MNDSKIDAKANSESSVLVSAAPSERAKRIDSSALFSGQREVVIDHGGAAYLLRITGQGKLILTK